MKKRAICIVSEFPPPYGGIAQQALLLDKLLKDNGIHTIKVRTNLPDSFFFKVIKKIPVIRTVLAEIYFLNHLLFNIFKADIIHILACSHLNFFIFTYPAVFLGRFFRKPVIIHYHGGAAESFLKKSGKAAIMAIQRASKLIVPSAFLSNVFLSYGLKNQIVPNILNLNSFMFTQRDQLKPNFVMTRHLEPIYNIACAIRAISIVKNRIPKIKLNIIGNGSQMNELKQLTDKLGCNDVVHFIGAVSNKDIPDFYKNADILLNTSNVDNMPVSLLEGMSSGCLIISTNAGGIPYLIDHAKTGLLVDLDDHNGLADTIVWALENQEFSKKMVASARSNLSRFSKEKIIMSLNSIYAEVAS